MIANIRKVIGIKKIQGLIQIELYKSYIAGLKKLKIF